MLFELLAIFLNVVLPVFGIVAIGYLLGPRLALDAHTLSRVAYYVFVPAFVFQAIGTSRVELGNALLMVVYITLCHLVFAALGWAAGRLLKRSAEVTAAFMMIAVFGNVGNFGIPLIRFRLGDSALVPATIYFVAIVITAFIVCVGAAGWAKDGRSGAMWSIFKTPALWAAIPAFMVSGSGVELPLVLTRIVGLLAGAMIPMMLLALGLQLSEVRKLRISGDVMIATGLRLLVAPAVAAVVAIPFGLGHVEYATGILQAGMPAAILVSILAIEHDVVPGFVTTTVFFSTLLSLLTLTVLLTLI
jgi:predicted permease